MKVSIIINTYNRLHSLPRTLESLKFLRYKDIEVIVVNGPSTDGTAAYLKDKWTNEIKILQCSEANLSLSRNIGVCAAKGEIVAFTDDDGVPEPDWLDKIMPAYLDNNVAAVGGFVRNHTGVDFQTLYIKSDRHANSDVLITSRADLPSSSPGEKEFVGLIGVNSTFRRHELIRAGGFDIEYSYFLDETDALVRLVDAGYKVVIMPDAEVHHKYASSHIRNESGVAKTWLPTARSISYFCLKNAPYGQTLSETLDVIREHENKLTYHTEWAYKNGLIDQTKRNYLIDTLSIGIREGIHDAFAYPDRRLIDCNSAKGELKTFAIHSPLGGRRRLAFLTDLYPPRQCGGVAVFIYQLATTLAKIGHEITVITLGEPDRPHTVDFEDGVWVHRLPNDYIFEPLELDGLPDMPPSICHNSEAFLAELLRIEPHRQFEWVMGTIWDMHLAAVIAFRKWPVAMYLVTTYQLMLESKPEWRSNLHFFSNHVSLMIAAERWGLENANCIFASTNAILHDVEAVYGYQIEKNRLSILPFGIRPPTVGGKGCNNGNGRLRVLFVGRFETRKGIDVLLNIVPELLSTYPDLAIELIGDNSIPSPNGKPYLSKFLKKNLGAPWLDRLITPGVVSDEDLEQAYSRCDIFVAPSRYESFGLIYVEAMRYGKPCIGCDVGGVSEVVINGETGLLVPPGNSNLLMSAMTKLIVDYNLRQRLGTNGKKRYRDKFTLSAFANGFLAGLKEAEKTMHDDIGCQFFGWTTKGKR
jgi:glycosyltransferase involved in cell wall biosynthesis